LVPLSETFPAWGEGASAANAGVSGAGSGAPAEAGDATWLHSRYDPASHAPADFVPDGPGYWPEPGALGDDPLDPWARFGDPTGMVASEIGPVVFSSVSMESSIDDWIRPGAINAGWILIGDETLASDLESSNRGFASREHSDPALRPNLSFEYVLIPEPSSAMLLLVGTLICSIGGLRRWTRERG
jgi:hypothetical protein